MSSSPVAGHPDAQAPQVRQRFRLPPSGNISFTLSKKQAFLSLSKWIATVIITPFYLKVDSKDDPQKYIVTAHELTFPIVCNFPAVFACTLHLGFRDVWSPPVQG
jgi:hypothetical protein